MKTLLTLADIALQLKPVIMNIGVSGGGDSAVQADGKPG